MDAYIKSLSFLLPENVVTNFIELTKNVGRCNFWQTNITSKIGIEITYYICIGIEARTLIYFDLARSYNGS